jgi:hypothetical protein
VPPCCGTDLPIFVEAFLDDPHFVCIVPMSPADAIRRGHNFNRGFEFKVAHKVGAITQTQIPSGGPPRRRTSDLGRTMEPILQALKVWGDKNIGLYGKPEGYASRQRASSGCN